MIISETVIRNIVKNVLKRVLSENVDEETYNAFHGSPSARIEQGKFKRGKYIRQKCYIELGFDEMI